MPIETNFNLLEDIAQCIFEENHATLTALEPSSLVRSLVRTASDLEDTAKPSYDVFEIVVDRGWLDVFFVQLVIDSAPLLSLYKGKTPLEVVLDRVELTRVKNANYGGSWAKRGGPGAFFGYVRKIDRIESLVSKYGVDVFTDKSIDLQDESILDTFEDVIGYSMLILERRLQLYVGSEVEPGSDVLLKLVKELE